MSRFTSRARPPKIAGAPVIIRLALRLIPKIGRRLLEITGKDLHSSIREIAVLQEVTELILASGDTETVLHQTLLIVRNYFGVSNCAIFLVDEAAGEVYRRATNGYEHGKGHERIRIGQSGV